MKFGKPTTKESKSLVEMYLKRTRVFNPIESLELKESDCAKWLAKGLGDTGHMIIALDETGKEWGSLNFSKKLQSWIDDPGVKSLSFVIGGPYGLDQDIKSKAHELWSLSQATLPSDLAWVVSWEQLYRAFTILKGMPYHHG